MRCLPAVSWLVPFLFTTLTSIPAFSQSLLLVNGSTNRHLSVLSSVGPCEVLPGSSFSWPVVDGASVSNSVDGTLIETWVPRLGHDYILYLALDGTASLVDGSPAVTYWFWYGFAFSFTTGFLALGLRWFRRAVISDAGDPGGND